MKKNVFWRLNYEVLIADLKGAQTLGSWVLLPAVVHIMWEEQSDKYSGLKYTIEERNVDSKRSFVSQ